MAACSPPRQRGHSCFKFDRVNVLRETLPERTPTAAQKRTARRARAHTAQRLRATRAIQVSRRTCRSMTIGRTFDEAVSIVPRQPPTAFKGVGAAPFTYSRCAAHVLLMRRPNPRSGVSHALPNLGVFDQVRSKFDPALPDLTRFRPSLARVGPVSAESGPTLTEMHPNSANFSQTSANLGSTRAMLGPTWPSRQI